jgi:5-methylcytosine-specific restriction enzyme subunit McrC
VSREGAEVSAANRGDGPLLVIAEHEETTWPLSADDLAAIASLTPRVKVAPTETPGVYRICATSWVGDVGLPSLRLAIEPKVDRANLVHLMTRGERTRLFETEFGYAADRLLYLACDLFTAAANRALGAGVLHEYDERREDLAYVRGRLDLIRLAQRQGLVPPVPSVHAERTADVPANRMLAQASRALVHAGVGAERARRLRRILARLMDAGVSLDETVPPSTRFVVTRLNRRYAPALGLARLVLQGQGIDRREGETRATSFLVDMDLLFEDYVGDVLTRELAPMGLTVQRQRRDHLDEGRRIAIRPDLVVLRADAPVAVVDAKYKRLARGEHPDTADVFQLATYCERLGVNLAVLVYPQVERAEYRLRLPLGVRLQTLALPLEGDAPAWRRYERELARQVVGLLYAGIENSRP